MEKRAAQAAKRFARAKEETKAWVRRSVAARKGWMRKKGKLLEEWDRIESRWRSEEIDLEDMSADVRKLLGLWY